ncbi:hypothetical protein Bhz55_00058 [Stenotrophomonas phage vB_SmaS_Bhz55]
MHKTLSSFFRYAIVMTLVALMTACTVVSPAADEVAVLVDKPIIFGEGGVRDNDVRAGGTRTYTYPSTNVFYLSVKPVAFGQKFNDFATSDNAPLDFATTLRYRVTNAPDLIRLGEGWFDNSIAPQYADIVRREVKKYSLVDVMSDGAVADELDKSVTDQVKALVAEQKLPIEILSVNLGRAMPEPAVVNEMNQTVVERQRKLTMDQAKLAEDAREAQQQAKATADNAYRNGLGMSPEQFVTLELAKAQVEACKAAKECVIVPPGTPVVR